MYTSKLSLVVGRGAVSFGLLQNVEIKISGLFFVRFVFTDCLLLLQHQHQC